MPLETFTDVIGLTSSCGYPKDKGFTVSDLSNKFWDFAKKFKIWKCINVQLKKNMIKKLYTGWDQSHKWDIIAHRDIIA